MNIKNSKKDNRLKILINLCKMNNNASVKEIKYKALELGLDHAFNNATIRHYLDMFKYKNPESIIEQSFSKKEQISNNEFDYATPDFSKITFKDLSLQEQVIYVSLC
jgi:hypothetical protein